MSARVATGLALAAAAIGTVWLLATPWLALVFAVVAMVAAWEWERLLSDRALFAAAAVAVLAALLASLWFVVPGVWSAGILAVAALWWLMMFVLVSAYREDWRGTVWLRWWFRLGMPIVLAGAWLALAGLHRFGAGWLFYLLLLVAVSDIGAYYAGRRWGRRKLAPELSAGKTLEGLWGGLAGVTVLAVIMGLVATDSWLEMINLVLLSWFTAIVGVVGDLGMSLLKRSAGRKDSGTLLPGHGGVLDRIDSVLAAAPAFLLALSL